ncbi:MAG: DUF1643 domain-containing protein [Faecalibacterium sp.]|nr:DUF1643 domain-containing protein [Ruminococcus sp.]MCM1393132.1 DUF1643 domain-containing protein [Ruminococcus sp.]MCM1486472.1 DUF1643 domain-containing protein [Faecalibacterium sp.]
MHIPKSESHEVEIELFEQALEQSKIQSHIEYDVRDWLYVPNHYSEYRYILGTTGKNPLICIGINPSTAAPNDLDNTLKSVERIALGNGYDSFVMFNVYAQRATRPDDMDKQLNAALHAENMKAFEYVLSLYETEKPSVWAAWGNIVEMRPYLKDCLRDMVNISKKYFANWYSAGAISKKGHPHHPLYLKKDSPLDEFDMENYLDNILGMATV